MAQAHSPSSSLNTRSYSTVEKDWESVYNTDSIASDHYSVRANIERAHTWEYKQLLRDRPNLDNDNSFAKAV